MRYWLVMPAAGAGRRFGGDLPKQYAPLCGRTVIEWSLAPFLADARCAGAMVALAAADTHWRQLPVAARAAATTGGAERSQSVRAALDALKGRADPGDWVLVHDAARPCLDVRDLGRLLDQVQDHAVGGLLALRVADTLKRAQPATGDGPAVVAGTQERAGLWRALTPQMFRYGPLCAALDQAHAGQRFPTDEAQALEWRGAAARLVEGSPGNLKVTTTADLVLAAAILGMRSDHEKESI